MADAYSSGVTRAPPQPAVAAIAPNPAITAATTGQTLRTGTPRPRGASRWVGVRAGTFRADASCADISRDPARDTDNPPCSTVFGGCLVYIAHRRVRIADSPERRLTGQWSRTLV
ncbi:hypothetical protein GCM10010116_15560 [Microbispora rosea subsp. aerata]|nr:hypothetical protein GCM10010116_15560 [Microbispora rosea subsp. aerata]GIH53255.1 hypothetical protein Mro02_01690 [Microbispora rosea subsp. aerata]GLJ83833.1 hypothetical protein GCM10017588_25610 [Microbispora rosea subsp. aerata]